jgi:hypothetical protein
MVMLWTHLSYLGLSIALTVWVGWTLYRNGRVFLLDALGGNEQLADSLNHLLLVGFYLINVGFVALALKYGGKVTEAAGAVEYLSTKVGFVLLILGGMHFFNLFVLSQVRRRGLRRLPAAEALPVRGRRGPDARPDPDGLRTVAVPVDEGDRR